MDIEFYHSYCLSKPGVVEEFPFDKETLVLKVGGKIFSLFNIDTFDSVNLKCDPERAIHMRERYSGIKPGYHMNKKHWNTVSFEMDVPDQLILEMTDHSYDLVLNSLPKTIRAEISK